MFLGNEALGRAIGLMRLFSGPALLETPSTSHEWCLETKDGPPVTGLLGLLCICGHY